MCNDTVTITINNCERLKNSYGEEIGRILKGLSRYARIFDEDNLGWCLDPEYNLLYLRQQQNLANDMLKSKRYLLLNDVYKLLDIPKTRIGDIVGWVYDEENPIGDNFVDFGIYQIHNKKAVDCNSSYFILDFNVDGEILSRI